MTVWSVVLHAPQAITGSGVLRNQGGLAEEASSRFELALLLGGGCGLPKSGLFPEFYRHHLGGVDSTTVSVAISEAYLAARFVGDALLFFLILVFTYENGK
ncbi:MAG: hypothetical protein VYA34_03970 [Myxococcota bacterium]|nr:hypothetical protein [Myxococcota bacterium]